MRLALVAGILCTASLLQAASAAEPNACFNPRFEYSAQPAGYHELVAQNTIGTHTARVRVTPGCVVSQPFGQWTCEFCLRHTSLGNRRQVSYDVTGRLLLCRRRKAAGADRRNGPGKVFHQRCPR